MSRKILMVCYYFPPLLDVGCKRSVAFSKYLKAHGWEPHVLSVRNPDKHYCMLGADQPPSEVPVTYIRSLGNITWPIGKLNGIVSTIVSLFGPKLKRNYLYDFFCIPDLFIGWIPSAITGGYKLIKKQTIDIIYISCTPFSSALSGIVLKKLTGKPLVIDFRDPMAVNRPESYGTTIYRKKIDALIERYIISHADLFVVNTDDVRKGYLAAYPEIANKTVTIHNGFDKEMTPSEQLDKYEKYTVVYGGNLYAKQTNTEPFFEAIALLKEDKKIDSGNFQFLYFGQDNQYVMNLADKYRITDLVHPQSLISHSEMLTVLKKSHLQLLKVVKPMISTKLFEGIALNLPFLATIPAGEAADIITQYSPSSRVVHEDSPQVIAVAVMSAITDQRLGTIENNLVEQFLENFSRENMTRKLEKFIEMKLQAQ